MRLLLRIILINITLWPIGVFANTPFFDIDPSTVYTPKYTLVEKEIDLDVLKICGGWGGHVNNDDVKTLVTRHDYLVKKVNARLQVSDLTLDEMKEIWTVHNAFGHVFCGQPGNSLGGLHYAPRYKQGQDDGWISMCGDGAANESCINNKKNEYVASEGTYSVPVYYKRPGGDWGSKSVSGYNINMNADEILVEGTLAYIKFRDVAPDDGKDGCIHLLHPEAVGEYVSHKSVAAMTKNGLITFYSVGPIGEDYSINKYGTKESCE